MAIARLKKLSLFGPSTDKAVVLQSLQETGGIHLIAPDNDASVADKTGLEALQDAVKALKYLRQCPRQRHQALSRENFDMNKVVAEVLAIQEQLRIQSDRCDFLEKRIADLQPWGDFQLPEADQLAGLKLWFYIVPKRSLRQLHRSELVWQIAHQDNLYYYVVVVSASEPPAASMPVERTHTGTTPLPEVKAELRAVKLTLEDLQAQRESLTRWMSLLNANLVAAENRAQMQYAQRCTRDKDSVFLIQGWVAEKEASRYQQFAQAHGLGWMLEDPADDDKPPTLLTDNKQWAGGEDLVLFYQTPDYRGWDPSKLVFFSFAVFFAMILSDAGYAAVFAALLAVKWRRMSRSETGRRLRVLAAVAIAVSLLWGILTGVYFGVTPPEHSLLGRLRVLNIEDFSKMMHISIAAGVAHLALANLVSAWQRRGRRSAFAALGWAGLAPAGMLFWYQQNSGSMVLQHSAYGLLGLCVFAILWCSSERPMRKPLDYLRRLVEGFEGLIGISKIFGDIMSYMRLFALGLAGASLALTFNQLAHGVYQAYPGPGLLLAILILLFGHGLNIALCILSGVVHGLRLNFIEFYNWSVTGEGYPFKAFCKQEVQE